VKAPLAVAVIVLAALSVAALAVVALEDSATLVPPPEAVVEGYLRALTRRRYEQALSYVAAERRDAAAGEIRLHQRAIERAIGKVDDVRGEAGARRGARAGASARLRGRRGEARLRFDLVRRHGEWRLTSLGGPGGALAAEDGR
jgi:hypothetical protein